MRSDGEISKSEFEEFKNEIDEQLKSVEGEIELLEIKKNSVKNRDEEINRLNYIINQIDFIDDMNTIEVNAFLKTIINKVYFTSNESKLDSTAKGLKNRENFTVEIEYKE